MQFSCPHCAQPLEVEDEWAGSSIECPNCQQSLVIPSPTASFTPSPVAAPRTIAPVVDPLPNRGLTSRAGLENTRRNPPPKKGGRGILVLGFLLVAGAAGAYFYSQQRQTPPPVVQKPAEPLPSTPTPTPPPTPTPTPELTPTPTPEPTATPIRTPVAASTATPTPDALAWLLSDRNHWPKQVVLMAPVEFPVVVAGRTAGTALLPVGTTVDVSAIDAQGVTVIANGGTRHVPIESTDLRQRALAKLAKTEPVHSATPTPATVTVITPVETPAATQSAQIAPPTPAARSLPADGPSARLEDKGDEVILNNGIIAATVVKSRASVSSLKFRGVEMEAPSGRGSNIYFSMDGGDNYMTPGNCVYSVKKQTPDMVEVVCKRVWKNEPQAFDIEVHYILRRGDAGLYVYAVLDHPANYPATGYGEWRMVWRTPNEAGDWICVDPLRHWQMPNPEDRKTEQPTGIKEIVKLTQGPRAGLFDCKYDFNASYYDLGCWGHAFEKSRNGAWIVLGGFDYFNDGPMKQDLNAAAGINHIHFGMNHYNGSNPRVAAGEKWTKMYGPYLLYCNRTDSNGADAIKALWDDAKARHVQEQAAWPYEWLVGEQNYPRVVERGSVSGHLVLKDAFKPKLTAANAWVGVAQPEPGGNWQAESKHYQYWTHADAAGTFTIPAVRPGDYTLYAFTDGVVGEFSKEKIHVAAGQKTDEGALPWTAPHKGRTLAWEIGVPDRTAKEFRGGDSYFHGYVFTNFTKLLTNPLEYTVGKSRPETDWNYVHCGYGNDKLAPWKWRIHFKLDAAPSGDATLTIAFASADQGRVDVYANDENRVVATVNPSVQGGNALLRESIHAKYCVEHATIPASRLKAGDNVITLIEPSVKGTREHVMYDYLSLELP